MRSDAEDVHPAEQVSPAARVSARGLPFPGRIAWWRGDASSASPGRPSQLGAYLVLGAAAVFGAIYVGYLVDALSGVRPGHLALGLIVFKTGVEIAASVYGFAFLFISTVYLWRRDRPVSASGDLSRYPPVGILYLCCNDLDVTALDSLGALAYPGKLYLIVHDDSSSIDARAEVRRAVDRLRGNGSREVLYLSRATRDGGKPGAVNYALQQTGHLYDFFLLCDNDSVAIDPHLVERALSHFEDSRVAVVQCRNVGIDTPSYCAVNRLLSRSIDVFHVFMSAYSRFGWQPFVGHNAFLRTRDVLAVGGFTPGYFSDDLDLTVRLNVKGRRVVYVPELRMGEKHPPSYAALRKRSYKWAYGCMQTLKAHGGRVLRAPELTVAEKLSFFLFAGFYVGQTVLLVYMAVTFLIAPLILTYDFDVAVSLTAGSVIILLTYLPILSYFAKERGPRGWLGTVVMCGLVYGTADFSCARGVWDCLRSRAREWTPTNARAHDKGRPGLLAEAVFGIVLLCVPLLTFPAVLYLPCSYVFAGKFLFAPAMGLLYDDRLARRGRGDT